MAKRHERTRARASALQVLYTSEIQGIYPSKVATSESFLSEGGEGLSDYAQRLIEGVEAHQIEIDSLLASTSKNWSLGRMPIVDKSILRVATYEMTYVDEVPVSVSINEAVELAKDFGGEDDSPRFVNGVLGRIAVMLEERAQNAHALSEDASGESVASGEDAASGESVASGEDAADGESVASGEEAASGEEVAVGAIEASEYE